jgi:hypothetical protein
LIISSCALGFWIVANSFLTSTAFEGNFELKFGNLSRVARLYIFIPILLYFGGHTKENVLWTYGTFYGHLIQVFCDNLIILW